MNAFGSAAFSCCALMLCGAALADEPVSGFPVMPECGTPEAEKYTGLYCSQPNPEDAAPAADAAPLLPGRESPSPESTPSSPEPKPGVYETAKPPKTPTPFPYFGIGGEGNGKVSSLDQLDQVRSAQLAAFPLNYSEPITDLRQNSGSTWVLQLGVRVNDLLDVELASHGMNSYYSIHSSTDLADGGPLDNATALHSTEFKEQTFSLSLLPRWEYNAYFGVFGRIGVGYSKNAVHSSLDIEGRGPPITECTTDPATKVETCREIRRTETLEVSDIRRKSAGFVPVASIGIQLLQFCRLEYIHRFNVPIGSAETDISGLLLTFSFKSDFEEKLQ